MKFHVDVAKKEDLDFFFSLSYETLKALRKNIYDKLVEENCGKSDDEIRKLHREEMEEHFDFDSPTSRVFIVKREDGIRCGYLWMGLRNSEDPWDIQRPQWIYDIVVAPEFQGHGLGKMLMKSAEEFSKELNRNIGLFVHADNEHAIALYNKTGYRVKVIPISKRLTQEFTAPKNGSKLLIRNEQESEDVRRFELERFKRKVLFSQEAEDEKINSMYEGYLGKYVDDSKNHLRLEVISKNDTLVGSVWAGVSDFNDKIAMIYNLSIISQSVNDDLFKALIHSVEKWAKESGYSTLYTLLHSEDDIDAEMFKSMGYTVPGFFMEKKLTGSTQIC